MVELGQLESHHAEFEQRKIRVVAVALDSLEDAAKTQQQFPHLTIVADAAGKLVAATEVLHKGAGRDGGDTAAPTTIWIDRQGVVGWLVRPKQIITRLSPREVLAAADEYLKQ